jgi:hypothetical protein
VSLKNGIMNDARKLLIERCEEMEQKLKSPKEIDALDLGRILRQLLVDQHRLVDTANINKIPIRFRVHKLVKPPPGLSDATVESLQDGLDPDTAPPFLPPPIELTLDQFLKHVVLIINAQPHSVKDVIKFAARAMGESW